MDVAAAITPVSIAAPHPMGSAWSLEPGVTFLNHGSFGPSPQPVLQAREDWSRRIEREPMDFFVRRLEPELDLARERLAAFKIPKRVMVLEDLPRNAMGKAQKAELRRIYAGLFGSG